MSVLDALFPHCSVEAKYENKKSPLTLTIATVSLFIIGAHPTIAGTFASTQSGSWGSAATWGGAGVPGCGDTVTVSSGTTVSREMQPIVAVT